uniref:CWF21 domain-containing protein n=1 Tax=Meloidogyne javanica TaxID=6303 RepID=A0A915MCR4_MELJA
YSLKFKNVNNVGLSTACGSGTNAYVQSNFDNLSFSRNKIVYNAEEDIARAEAEVNKEPNLELLDHGYKRLIEIKCVEFQDLMGGKGCSEEEASQRSKYYSR